MAFCFVAWAFLSTLLHTLPAVAFQSHSGRGSEAFWPLDGIFGRSERPMASDRQRLAPEDTLSLYQCLHYVTKIFEANNVTYWAGAGTLLGAIRNNGVIPHDDDVDLQIPSDDVPKLLGPRVKADLERNGLKLISKYPGLWGITNSSLKPIPLKFHAPLPEQLVHSAEPPYPYFVDIFAMRVEGDQLVYENENPELKGRGFPVNMTRRLQAHRFGETMVYVPSEDVTQPYLDRIYGADWNTTVNCGGTLHGCRTAADRDWALTHHAQPGGPVKDPKIGWPGFLSS